jgi:hypothetical protein
MAVVPRRSDAVDVLVADGPGVDDQRPRDPLTSTVSMRTWWVYALMGGVIVCRLTGGKVSARARS